MKISILAGIMFASSLLGQTAAGLLPVPKMQFLDSSGHPLIGGLVYSYAGGTSTPLATYTDSTGGTPNANPVVLDSAGRAGIWLGAGTYKITLKTSLGVQVWSVDNVTAPTLSSGSVTIANGNTFTMAAGSITSIATALLPLTSGTYDLGSAGKPWNYLYVNHISTNDHILISTNNTYDLGTQALAWRNSFALTSQQNTAKLCGLAAGVLTSNCYSIVGTADGATNVNDYLTVKDDAGTDVWQWARRVTGSTKNTAYSGLHILPMADATYDLGSAASRWRNIWFSGNLNLGALVATQMTISGGAFPVMIFNGATLGSIGAAVPGIMVYCSDCHVATPCTNAGLGAWAFGTSGSTWNCPF